MKSLRPFVGAILIAMIAFVLFLLKHGGHSRRQPSQAIGTPDSNKPLVESRKQNEDSKKIQTILASDHRPFLVRHEQLQGLGSDLSQKQCEELYAYLKQPMAEQEVNIVAAIKNDVMDVLQEQVNLSAPWHQMLINLIKDADQHPVTRDYALQHLFEWYGRASANSSDATDAARDEARQIMWTAIEEFPSSIRATALLGMHYLVESDPAIDPTRFKAVTLQMVAQSTLEMSCRLTALQVSSRLKFTEVLPIARDLAASATAFPLRLSAIATLGTLGQGNDLALLQNLAGNEQNDDLRPAIVEAIKNLTEQIKG